MLIYVNQIKVNGSNALDSTLKTVAGWLKELTKRHFTPEELKISEDYIIGRQKVRTYNASQAEPFLYSILFSKEGANKSSHSSGFDSSDSSRHSTEGMPRPAEVE
ncbi:hypothetical protein [Shewanella sp. Isolate7]|uniref:hypothetical protein n=1 Tax=Shewanella sp. Isolate7 TaxID=2908528 RepID=UPI001EFEB311|nr:hypothetical protein [Shewanella sp. Isolate7]MCG9722010.1 hypothetical protein [Shewanella sp. Isolate7]